MRDAEELASAREVLEVVLWEAIAAGERWAVASLSLLLGDIEVARGEIKKAGFWAKQAEAAMSGVGVPDSLRLRRELLRSTLANGEGRSDRARVHIELAQDLLRRGKGLSDELVVRTTFVAGMLAFSEESFEEAERYLNEARRLLEERFGPNALKLEKVYGMLGVLAACRGDFERSRAWHERAINKYREVFKGRVSRGLAHQLSYLAVAYAMQDEQEQALRYHRETITVLEASDDGVVLQELALARTNEAMTLATLQRYEEAEGSARRALKRFEGVLRKTASEARAWEVLAVSLHGLGRYAEALKAHANAIRSLAGVGGAEP